MLFNRPGKCSHLKVGLVFTIWGGGKSKPRIACSDIPVMLVHSVRVAEMQAAAGGKWKVDTTSTFWNCRLEGLVAVLDAQPDQDIFADADATCVALTDNSHQVATEAATVIGWSAALPLEPEQEEPAIPPSKKTKDRKARPKWLRRSKCKVAAKKTKKTQAKPPKSVKNNLHTTATAAENVAIPENFRRSEKGRALVRSVMDQLRQLEEEAFATSPSLAPGMDGVCRVRPA